MRLYKKGFTYLEVMTVITILGILLYMAVPIYNNTVIGFSRYNINNQISSALDSASTSAKVNLKKVRVIFSNDKIDLILMKLVDTEWQNDIVIETVYLEKKIEVQADYEVIYGVDGFPEENKTILISERDIGSLTLNIYTDGRFKLE